MMMIYESYLLGGDRGQGVGLYWLKELVSLILSCVGGVINFNNMTKETTYITGDEEKPSSFPEVGPCVTSVIYSLQYVD